MDLLISALFVSTPFLIMFGILGAGSLFDFLVDFFERPTVKAKTLERPVIAYKRAQLMPPGNRQHTKDFKGVVGYEYGVSDEAITTTVGFHAYKSFKAARKHPQRGNVFLEVVLSGYLQDHDLGWTASKQRVLQVIPHCSFSVVGTCHKTVRRYHESAGELLFSCLLHTPIALADATVRFESREHISTLASRYPDFIEHDVVVAAESGARKFIPTKLSSTEDKE